MSVAPGNWLGPNAVGSMLGAGGVGEVRTSAHYMMNRGRLCLLGAVMDVTELAQVLQTLLSNALTCRRIVERHGGRIWAESNANCRGATSFTLPAIP